MIIPILLVLALSLEPPRDASCAMSDLACSARVHAAAAEDPAIPPEHRGQHAVAAARAYLLLFRKTGERPHLCSAKRWAARGGKDLSASIAARLAKTRTDIASELSRVDAACGATRTASPPSEPAIVAAIPVSRSIGPAPTAVPVPSSPPVTKPPPLDIDRPVRPADLAHRRARLDRAGVGLLAAGGVGFVVTAGLASIAGVAKVERDHAVEDGRALSSQSQAQGFTDPSMLAEFRELEADAVRWHRTMLGTSIVAGAVAVVAIALLSTGAHRQLLQPGPRVAIRPSALGLLLDARF